MKNWFRIVLAAVLFLAFTNLGMAQQKNAAIQNLIDKYESGQSITTAEKEMLSQYFNSIYQQAMPVLSKSKGIIATEDVILGPETFDTFPPTGWSVTSGLSGNAWFDTTNAAYGGGTDIYAGWDDDAWGSGSFDSTYLETPSFSTLGYASVTLTMDYGYRLLSGSAYGIHASTDGGATWEVVIANLPATSTSATAKYPESAGNVIFLDTYANQSDVRLRFAWEDGAGWEWYGALDNVLVEGSATTPPPNPALLVGPANAATGVSLIADLSWAPDGGGPSPNGYKIFFGTDGGGVTPPSDIENGTDLGNVTSYSQSALLASNTTYYWQVVAYNASGDATGSAIWSFTTADVATVTSFPLTEDFETFVIGSPGTYANGWTNGSGQVAWYVEDSGIQNSLNTGPLVDHTSGTGNYMYTEATGFSPNYSFHLLSPPLDLSAASSNLMSFWYHMYGATMGDLHVDVWSGGSWDLDVTSPLVGPQQLTQDDDWLQKFVDLSAYAGSTVILRFRGITGSSFTSDMAIDDVAVGITGGPDLAVTQFINLPTNSGGGATVSFDVEISNVGPVATGTATFDVWLNGAVSSTHGVAALGIGEKDTVSASIVTSATGTDNVTAALQTYPGDTDLSNDTLSADITILTNIPTPFTETWDTTTFDPVVWPEVTGTTEIIDVNGVATGTFPYAVPSDPYFLAMNGTNGSLASGIFDLSGLSDQAVMLWESEHDLEPGEAVILEYYTDAGAWDTLAYFPGTDNGFGLFEPFEKHSYLVPADGYHTGFKIRFRTIGALATTDEWFFDNIYIGPATDVGTTGHSAPALTHISNTQPGLLSSVNLGASFLNLGVANTGDLNVAVNDASGATVFSDASTGVTIPALNPATATFLPWDASGAADGDYSINYYTSNFVDVDPINDTLSIPFNIGTTMAYDNGVQSTSGTFSNTARSWFGVNYTLADDDMLNGVSILVSASALATDSFAVELWSVVNDTPSTPIASIAEGAYSDLGALPALVTFAIDPGLPLTAGTYSIVLDMKNTSSYPCGIDYTALGAQNVPRTFWGKLETTTWLAFEDVGAETWTPIIRAELGGVMMPPTPLPYTESFEDTSLTIPDGWTQFDADGGDEVVGADWRITSNGGLFPPLEGSGEIFNNYQAANNVGLIDEWLFTPQFGPYQSGMELSFNLIHADGVWDDSVMVLVSTTDNDPGSFTMIDFINCPIDWTEYSYNLGDYGVNDGDNFYIAFRYYIVDGGSSGNQSNAFSMDLMKIDFPAQAGNPPGNVSATPGAGFVQLNWEAPLPAGVVELGYDDGSPENNGVTIGATAAGDLAVRFTPNVYPSTVVGIKVWFEASADPVAMAKGNYSIWDGSSAGPGTMLASGNHPVNRGAFEAISLASGVTINSGDFFVAYSEPADSVMVMAWDTGQPSENRSWVNAPGIGLPWQTLGTVGPSFDNDLMIRAWVTEGSGPNARLVELGNDGSRHIVPMSELKSRFQQFNIEGAMAAGNLSGDVMTLDGSQIRPADPGAVIDPVVPATEALESYNIYRSEDDVTYSLLANVDATALSYQDNGLAAGTYWYYLTAVYSEGESDPSDTVSATVSAVDEEVADHTTASMVASVTNEGNIGWLNQFPPAPGSGFQFNPATTAGQRLFEGAIIVATDSFHVSDAARDENQVFDADFQFTSSIDGSGSMGTTTQYVTSYSDALAEVPLGIDITQTTYSVDEAGKDRMVLFQLDVANNSGTNLADVKVGAFFDWDVAASASDRGRVVVDSTNTIPGVNGGNPFAIEILELHPGAGANAYMGIVPLSQSVFAARRIMISADEVYPPRMTDGDKWSYLSFNRATNPNGDGGSAQDHAQIFGLSPMNINNGASERVGFAMVAGATLGEMMEAARAAQQMWVDLGNTIFVVTGIEDGFTGIPTEFSLEQNYPNPFNPTTTIRYGLREDAKVSVKIYNVLGQVVKTLVNGRQTAGFKTAVWDGTNEFGAKVSSGIYIYRIEANDFVDSKKMILLK